MINSSRKKVFLPVLVVFSFLALLSDLWGLNSEPCDCLDCHKTAIRYRLRTQEIINESVVQTATRVYGQINQNWNYPNSNATLSTTSHFWEAKWIPGEVYVGGKSEKTNIPTLCLKVPPSYLKKALDDLISNPARLECTIASKVVQILCLFDILGPAFFNPYAATIWEIVKENKELGEDSYFHTLVGQFFIKSKKKSPGELTYISNIPKYIQCKPNGFARGSNVFSVGPDQYIGFALLYRSGPKTIKDIEISDLVQFCTPQDVERVQEQHQALSLCFRLNRDLFFEEHRNAQDPNIGGLVFDKSALENFINTGEARALMK